MRPDTRPEQGVNQTELTLLYMKTEGPAVAGTREDPGALLGVDTLPGLPFLCPQNSELTGGNTMNELTKANAITPLNFQGN